MPETEELGSAACIREVLDAGSFSSWDTPIAVTTDDEPYRQELLRARERTGLDESVVTGSGRVDGRPVAVIVSEFAFLGGSIGVDVSERIVAAVERATREGLPLLAAPVSGGTRMQEGTRAFVRMLAISAAISLHKAAGLPYLVYLRNPTMGGVFASWGSMGHITAAEPGALIGFLGPRVHRVLTGEDLEPGVQSAENLYRHGIVDAVVPQYKLARLISSVLAITTPAMPATGTAAPSESIVDAAYSKPAAPEFDDWTAVETSRQSSRAGLRSLLHEASDLTVPLNGAGAGETDRAIMVALARMSGRGVVVVGQDRRARGVGVGPEALRVAQRGVRLAQELRLPLVAVIDTPGAALSLHAEEGGLSGEIGRSIVSLLEATIPTVAVILGQGVGGAALALVPCDTVLVAEGGWMSPLPPEGASAIVYRDAEHAPQLARRQRVGSANLVADGIADELIAEGAASVAEFLASVGDAIARALRASAELTTEERLRRRYERYHRIGLD
jgi:acetyl-CoA carboxylase carboxyl transferase beta subunit